MSARRRHKGGHEEEEHENEERWLVSFADMMTLLFCLFMVLFAISSVNTSKFEALQKALENAFSGKILSGGEAVMESGNDKKPEDPSAVPPLPSLTPLQAMAETSIAKTKSDAAKREEQDFKALKRRIDALVAKEGLTGKVSTTIRKRGLVVELLTDNVFFDSGQAQLKPPATAPARQARRRAERRGDAPDRRRGSYRRPADRDLSVPQQLGAVGRPRVRGHPHFRGRRCRARPSLRRALRRRATHCQQRDAEGRSRNRRVDVILTRLHQES